NSILQPNKVIAPSSPLIVIAADRSFRHETSATPQRIVALAVELCVFGIGKSSRPQTMPRIKSHPHPEEHGSVLPHLGKKIWALVQTYTIQRRHRTRSPEDIITQTLSGNGTLAQSCNVFVEIAVVEFVT